MHIPTTDLLALIGPAQLEAYHRDGYFIAKGLWQQDEIQAIRKRFDKLAQEGKPVDGYWNPQSQENEDNDPLERYPRVMMPHRWDDLSRSMLLDPRIGYVLSALLEEQPIAAQSMYYFKPPGSRGQAFHQDNFYLNVHPNTCIAAWTAIDPAIPSNGGLQVVPGTHHMDLQCPELADASESFTTDFIRYPADKQATPVELDPGDVLFFNGSVIHGSQANTHASLWRRSFICHYLPVSSSHISEFYFPLLNFHGNEVTRHKYEGGGPCGTEF